MTKELFAAIHKGNVLKVKKLLKAGANANARDDNNNTPLHIVMMMPDTELINRTNLFSLLLEYGANLHAPNDAGNTPADYAIGRMV